MKRSRKKKITAAEFDKEFESGDVTSHLDWKNAKINRPIQRINIDIPKDMLKKIDQEAARIGVARTALIKMWLAQQVDHFAA